MTVALNDTIERYVIAGVGPYPFSFRIFDESELSVKVIDTTPMELALVSNFTVPQSAVNSASGGLIWLSVETAASYAGKTLDIRSNTAQLQPTSIRNQARFLPEIHEDAFDRLCRQVQDLRRQVQLAVRLPDSEIADAVVPEIPGRKGRYLFSDEVTGALTWVANVSSTALSQSIFNQYQYDSDPYKRTAAETAALLTPSSFRYLPGEALRFGADPTGVLDSTLALQRWIDATWAMYNYVDVQGVWSGAGGASPVLTLPPGKFKVTGTLYLPNGITIRGTGRPANTINHTRIIMDSTTTSAPNGAGDNRNKPMFKFRRGSTPSGGVLVNQYFLSTIQDIEFGYVTPGSTFGSPYSGSGIPFGDYPDGGTFVIDVDTVDLRFVGCCFQHTPAAIRIKDVPASSTVRADGFTGNTGAYGYMEDCELDAAASHIYSTNAYMDWRMNNCKFYGGRSVYKDTAGKVVYDNPQLFGDAWIDASDAGNNFTLFQVKGGSLDLCTTHATVSVANANTVELEFSMTGASGNSGVELFDCSGGRVSLNIQGSGYNAPAGTGLTDFKAAIKALGCRNTLFVNNAIRDGVSVAGTYNGFGILLGDSGGRTSQGNVVDGNHISAPFNAANFNNQNRYLNFTASDAPGRNYLSSDGGLMLRQGSVISTGRTTDKRVTAVYGATVAIDALLGNVFELAVTNNSALAISAPTNPYDGQRITLAVSNQSGGAMGVITWNAVFKMAAWTNPANGTTRSIDFRFNGVNWRQVGTPLDVPN